MLSARRHSGRQGFGIIFGVIVLFLIVMITMGFAQFVFGSRVASDTQSSIIGSIATSIGQSAFEEAWRDAALAMNTKGDPLYAQMRKEITDPAQALHEFTVPVVDTIKEMEGTENYAGFKITDGVVKAEVLGEGTMAGLIYENMGTLKLTVNVRHKPTGVSRTLTATRGFKVALLSTPRPFDQTTFLVMNPGLMIDREREPGANRKIRESLTVLTQLGTDVKPKLIKQIEAVVKEANDKLAEAEQQPSPVEQFTQPVKDAIVPAAPEYSEDVKSPRHFFPEAPGDYVIYTLEKEIADLSKFYLVRIIEAKSNDIETARVRYNNDANTVEAVLKEIDTAVRESDSSYINRRQEVEGRLLKAVNAVKASMTDLAARQMERLDIYKEFTDYFSERSKDGAAELQQFASKFDIQAAQAGRAFYKFSGAQARTQLKQLLEKYDKQAKPLNAVVLIDTGGQVVSLDNLRVHGKLVLLVTGKAAISNVSLTDPALDLLTVLVDGRVTIDNRVQASIMAGSDVELGSSAILEGNLILLRSDSAQSWRGKLVRDSRYQSSMKGSPTEELQGHVVVAFSPRPASLIVDRQ